MMLTRHRISNRDKIKHIFETAPSLTSHSFVVKYASLTEGQLCFAVLVGVNLAPKAVTRNFLRRRIREAAIKNMSILHKPCNLVIIARRGIQRKTYQELSEELKTLFTKIDRKYP